VISQPVPDFPLDAASRGVLNEALLDCDLASVVVDAAARTVVVSFYATGILPGGGLLQEAYPLFLVARPAGRIAVRHTLDGEVLPVRLDGIDAALDQFDVKYMDDWDIVDPPEQYRLRWTGQELSLDARLGEEDLHVIELWQDERPRHGLDIGVWFGRLYVLDRALSPVTPAMITAWRQRWHDEATAFAGPRKGVSITVPQDRPSLDLAAVLALTGGPRPDRRLALRGRVKLPVPREYLRSAGCSQSAFAHIVVI
jgi:hypothetical protein